MSVRVIKEENVYEHIGANEYMKKCFKSFFKKLQFVDWQTPQDITQTFKSADLITCKKGQHSRIVFNIGRNKFRMICGYFFADNQTILYIKFVGTHKEYDNVNVCDIDQFKKRK